MISGNKFFLLNKKSIILAIIILVGIFLRTYHFHDWLYFYPDQARDVQIVQDVISGKTGWPLLGSIAASTQFRIGPMYNYFQIISGYIFGVRPETMAYPDLFFAILSILLFYIFLKRYFSDNLSLALTGLYSISFYAIRYSRFAWNPNPIPFFVLLFLMAVTEFIIHKENTKLLWIIIIGVTLGIGIQLHTLLLLLLPGTLFFVFLYLMWKNWQSWKKWVVIILIAFVLNIPQFISEINHHFYNTKLFFKIFTSSSQNGKDKFLENIELLVLGYSQANVHILTSLGNENDLNFMATIRHDIDDQRILSEHDKLVLAEIVLSGIFLLFGFLALTLSCIKESDTKKKIFLGLIILYSVLSVIIMFPVMDSLSLRYFIQVIFLPFIFLGLVVKILEKFPKFIYLPITVAIFCILAVTNFMTIRSEAQAHQAKDRSSDTYVVLGEIEMIRDYIIAHSNGEKAAYFYAEGKYMQNYIKPLSYVSSEKNFIIIRAKDPANVPSGKPLFMIGRPSEDNNNAYVGQFNMEYYQNFGQIGVYKLAD